ncbi:MAG: membrane integrity-associated transporter subunit PqiC [Alphaproteobacteria bacterium]|nr:membrane integrity-associated transporter subunit PqiC [Alphaproteobacteria bacterium]
MKKFCIKTVINTIALCFLLSACVPGESQTAKFYTLKSENKDIISEKYKNSVCVSRVHMPKFMDKTQIISQSKGKSEIIVSEYNRWVEPLSILYTHYLIENLSTLLPNSPVKISTGADSFNRYVAVDIVKLEFLWNVRGTLEAWYTIKTGNGQVLECKKFTDSMSMGNRYEDLVKVHSKLLGNLSKTIAKNLVKY